MIDLEAIEARLKAATPGPWMSEFWDGLLFVSAIHDAGGSYVCELGLGSDSAAKDAAFIAAAPTDVAALIAEVRRLRAALEVIEAIESGRMTHTRTAGDVARAALEGETR